MAYNNLFLYPALKWGNKGGFYTFYTDELDNGIYFLTLYTGNQLMEVEKMLVGK